MSVPRPVVLVTGADGFVGRALIPALSDAGWRVRRATRRAPDGGIDEDFVTGLELTSPAGWREALDNVQAVVHTAARVHLPRRVQKQEKELYWSINVDGTKRLAQLAVEAEVKHFVFLSSVAVNGNTTDGRGPFTERDLPAPETIYGESKAAAEQELSELSDNSPMQVTAIRAPMIHGHGARGNFRRLSRAVDAGIPLPFSGIGNRRAFLGIDNLASFVTQRLNKPAGSGFGAFLLADDEQVSTPDFVRLIGRARGRRARLFSVPASLLRAGLDLFNLGDALSGNLEIDASKARAIGWRPSFTLADGLRRAAQIHP